MTHYPSPEKATEAALKKHRTKYGSGPQVFIYRSPDGFGFSLTRPVASCPDCQKDYRSPDGFGFSLTKPTRVMKRSTVLILQEKKNYFREALKAIIGKYPPMEVPPFGASGMGDEVVKLQDWCSDNANPEWATGLSMIEAAELIVDQAVENANISKD